MSKMLALFNIDMSWVWKVAIIVGIILIVYACIRYPKGGKWVLMGVLVIAYIGVTAYSIVQLNFYYKAEGGIIGQITGIFDTNKVEVVDNLKFDFNNVELTQVNGNKYQAKFTTNEVLNLDNNIDYGLYVNNMPCYDVQATSDYVIAKYGYTFYDNSLGVKCTDILTFNIAFNGKYTELVVITRGGSVAVKYWNNYFNKNSFILEIKEKDYPTYNDIEIGTGDISSYPVVTFYTKNELLETQIYRSGDTIKLPIITDDNFIGWAINGELIDNTYIVNNSVTIIAVYDEVQVLSESEGTYHIIYENSDFEIVKSSGLLGTAKNIMNCKSSDSIVFYATVGTFRIDEVLTDGDYNITQLDTNKYQLSWTNASYVNIDLYWSGVSGL